MKNFLKSMAIFASVALLFGACSEDSTEDVAEVVVPSPTEMSATALSAGQITVGWTIPEICDADQSVITWIDEAGVAGYYTYEGVAPGETYEYTIGEDTPLTQGVYSVTIANVVSTTGDFSLAAVQEVAVYTADSYASQLPVPVDYYYEEITSTSGVVHITWGAFDEDCTSVTIYYGTDFGTPKKVTNLVEGEETELNGVLPGAADFKYVATFAPTEDSEEVSVWSEVLSLGTAPVAPTNLVAKAGLNRFEISWELSDITGVEEVYIVYGESGEVILTGDEFVSGANTLVVDEVEAGDYALSIYTVTAKGFKSDIVDLESDVFVFDADTFSYPLVTSVENEKGEVSIYTATADYLTSFSVKYTKTSGSETTISMQYVEEYDEEGAVSASYYTADLADAKLGGSIVFTNGLFEPDNVIDGSVDMVTLEDEDTGYSVPAADQNAPVVTEIITSKDGSISLTWTIEGAYDLAASVVTLDSGSSTLDPIVATLADQIVDVEDGFNTTSFTVADGVVPSTTYKVSIQTMSTLTDDEGEGLLSSTSTAIYVMSYTEDTYSKSNYPSASTSFSEGQVSIAWSGIGDVQGLVVSYAGSNYTYGLVDGTLVLVDANGDALEANTFAYVNGEELLTFSDVVFLPTFGVDPITVDSESSSISIFAPTPDAPSAASVTAGYDATSAYLVVDWTISSAYAVDGATSVVYYKSSTDEEYTAFETISNVVAGETSYTSANIPVTAGLTYDVQVVLVSEYGVSSSATAATSVVAYDATSYTDVPSILSVTLSSGDTTDAEVVWNTYTGADLISVEFTYETTDGSFATASAVVTDGVLAESITLEGVAVAGAYSYVATFCPSYGIEGVAVLVDGLNMPSASTPELESVSLGYSDGASTIKVDWTILGTDGIDDIRAYYLEGTGVEFDSTSTSYTSAASVEDLSLTITGLEAEKTYTIYIAMFDGSNVYEDAVNATTVTTYGVATYLESALPTLTAAAADDKVTLTWGAASEIADLYSVTYTYGTTTNTILVADLATSDYNTVDYSFGTESIVYYASYQPADGDGAVAVVETAVTVTFDEQAPSAPSAVAVSTYGYNDSGSYATITWTNPASSTSTISNNYVYAVDADGTTAFESDEVASDATTYTFTGLTADATYTLYVASQTANDITSAAVSTTVTAYNADSYTTANLPTYTAKYDAGVATITWGDLDDAITSLTLTYNGVAQTVDLSGDSATSAITYNGSDATFTYEATFQPTGGANAITVTGGAGEFPTTLDIELVSGVYQINSAKGLAAFADLVNGTTVNSDASLGDIVLTGSAMSNIDGKLTADIDLSTVCSSTLGNWTPIGTATFTSASSIAVDAPYSGTFDGAGYVVSGLYISSSSQFQGLFGYVEGGTIKNVTIENPYFYLTSNSWKYAGALIGRITGDTDVATVSDCKVIGSAATIQSASSAAVFGGVIGQANGETNAVTIERCSNQIEGTVTTVGQQSSAFLAYAAGTVTLVECFNTAALTGGNQYVGGLVGISASSSSNNAGGANLTLIACYNTGSVTSTSSSVGGLTGQVTGTSSTITMTGCYNTGNVTGTDRTGGVFGGARYAATVTFTSCYNTGAVVGTSGTVGSVIGSHWTNSTTSTYELADCYYLDYSDGITFAGASAAVSTNTGDASSAFTDISSVIANMNASLTDYEYAADGTISAK